MRNMFIEIQTLTSYSSVLLNRDDFGSPKTCFLGGTERTRISSQCQKYAWRNSLEFSKWSGRGSERSRHIFVDIATDLTSEGFPRAEVINALLIIKQILLPSRSRT